MTFSITMKYLLANILHSTGYVSWKARKYRNPDFLILMYHRVVHAKKNSGYIEPGMLVKPETFELHVSILKKYFKVVPLREIMLDDFVSRSHSDGRPLCALTFDDGWHDFYTNVFPILMAKGIPATVFLPTGFIGTQDWFWTDRLGYIFDRIEEQKGIAKINVSHNMHVKRLENMKGAKEAKMDKAISSMKLLPEKIIEDVLLELSTRWGLTADPSDRAFLSWEEIIDMSKSGLVAVGSHTNSHNILTTLEDERIWNELILSKEALIEKNVVDPSFIPFCYPNGNYNRNIMDIVEKAGYSLAVTTENGWNRCGSNIFCLKRMGIHQDMTATNAMFECKVFGIV